MIIIWDTLKGAYEQGRLANMEINPMKLVTFANMTEKNIHILSIHPSLFSYLYNKIVYFRIFRGYMARKYARDLKLIEKERQKRAAIMIQRYLLSVVVDVALEH